MKIIISLILVCYSTLAFSFGFRFAFLQKYGIKLNSTYRTYGDGRFAKSCNEYINANGRYSYTGDVGDGIYRIQPDAGSAFDVFCDMTTNGGGWTMVLNLEAVSDTYGWSNSFWTDSSTLNTTTLIVQRLNQNINHLIM